MKQLIISLIILFSILAFATSKARQDKQIRVGIVDTGLNSKEFNLPICEKDSKSFVGRSLNDDLGHGTLMARVIKKFAKDADFCFVIVKVFSKQRLTTPEVFIKGIEYLSTLKLDIVNISAGGPVYSEEEKSYIRSMIKKGVFIVVASGNDNQDLDKNCNYFPACYTSDLIVVGAQGYENSNHGKIVDVYAPYKLRTQGGTVITQGTSVSTAFITGNLIRTLYYKKIK